MGRELPSYADESFAGVGTSTPSQTAWAVMTLQWAGLGDHSAAQRGLSSCGRAARGRDVGRTVFYGYGVSTRLLFELPYVPASFSHDGARDGRALP